ncbi:DUF1707 SHOCT-like domain-containing protein [Actinokineospora sp. G85]|uniref:DUF1707 SHOCT-like domain-containing protein n=1 Tax=Actinokineospora sp. G85 TaxID=3406626 RepID=UPI003C791F14
MAHSRDTRISDDDRRIAADELRAAQAQGRLTLTEYDERLTKVGTATTYGDISKLFTDLPVAAGQNPGRPSRAPKWVRIVWTWWIVTLVINLLVWALVFFQFSDDVHFWPIWLLIPTIAIAAVTYKSASTHREKQDRRQIPNWRR